MNNKTPMELLKQFAPEFAENQMQEKALIFENEEYQKVPNKYKMLTCLPVGRCGQIWQNKMEFKTKKLLKQ